MNDYTQLKELVEGLADDFLKFHEKNVKKSGTKIRKSLMEVKKLIEKMRKDVLLEVKKQQDAQTRKMIIVDEPEDSDEKSSYHSMKKADLEEPKPIRREEPKEDPKKKFKKPRKRQPKK